MNLFLADDDEEMGAFNIRSAGYDLAGVRIHVVSE